MTGKNVKRKTETCAKRISDVPGGLWSNDTIKEFLFSFVIAEILVFWNILRRDVDKLCVRVCVFVLFAFD